MCIDQLLDNDNREHKGDGDADLVRDEFDDSLARVFLLEDEILEGLVHRIGHAHGDHRGKQPDQSLYDQPLSFNDGLSDLLIISKGKKRHPR
jgi:hypothetical protein